MGLTLDFELDFELDLGLDLEFELDFTPDGLLTLFGAFLEAGF
jgi:hypothetical protein